jgi:hypothetical protein
MAGGNDNKKDKPMTHVAWAMQRRRKGRTTFTVPLETGVGRIDPDGTPRMFLDREPKAGYGSYDCEVILLPRGVTPETKAEPVRPGQADGDGADDESNSSE